MRELSFEDALTVYEQLPPHLTTAYHHPEYLIADAKRNKMYTPVFLSYTSAHKVYYHPFLLCKHSDKVVDIESAYGYGGPVSNADDLEFLNKAHSETGEWCKRLGVLAEFIRFHPVIKNENTYRGEVKKDRDTVIVDLNDDYVKNYDTRVRTLLKKSEKLGLMVKAATKTEFLEHFPKLYSDAMRAIAASDFYFFPREYFEQLLNTKFVLPLLCYHEGTPVAGAMFFLKAPYAEYHLSASTPEGKKLGATNLIIDHALAAAQAKGCLTAHLGGGVSKDPNDRLLFFKSGFSKKKAEYKIGHYVYNKETYETLKYDWRAKHGTGPDRVLFYR